MKAIKKDGAFDTPMALAVIKRKKKVHLMSNYCFLEMYYKILCQAVGGKLKDTLPELAHCHQNSYFKNSIIGGGRSLMSGLIGINYILFSYDS